ncbi:hypothetical protein N7478_000851 [Penicillium angulare]|uniref:uncharacterized protein n=1 Tax=Penicillium angulare TaxID=116970 RepID=UPI00254193E4|nr:uncharacterized protein N7478_000851 [Penicillium angulare]KAJ5291600.1 hypothetical protein N7478_000851 [Penicillium angulare]
MTMNPYISWALLLVVAGSLGWYYTNGSAAPKAKAPVRAVVEKAEATVAPKKQKKKTKAPEPAKKPELKTVVSPPTSEDEKAEDDVDPKEMARRVAAIKNGTNPAAAPGSKNQKKKAKKTQQLESGSHASSTTGADADDDLSPAVSPQVNAVPSAGYVSDMLESPAPGASVLRVTGNVESEPKKQKVQNFKQVETKKQRQQRQKNEVRKQQVQEAEEQRRQLLEKQLHTAREHERREAARSQAPATNAWQTKEAPKAKVNGAPKAAPAPASTSAPVQLLDTFEPSSAPAQKKWTQELPSEEEQMRILGAANGVDEWTTVSKTKKTKKKGGKADESVSETSASENQPTPVAPLPVEPKVTVTPTYIPDILRSREKGHPLDSDWAA